MDEDEERERVMVEDLVRAATRISNLSHRRTNQSNQSGGSVQGYIGNAFPTARGQPANTSGLPGPSTGKRLFKKKDYRRKLKNYITFLKYFWSMP